MEKEDGQEDIAWQCEECGAEIHEDDKRCPHCFVEFENEHIDNERTKELSRHWLRIIDRHPTSKVLIYLLCGLLVINTLYWYYSTTPRPTVLVEEERILFLENKFHIEQLEASQGERFGLILQGDAFSSPLEIEVTQSTAAGPIILSTLQTKLKRSGESVSYAPRSLNFVAEQNGPMGIVIDQLTQRGLEILPLR